MIFFDELFERSPVDPLLMVYNTPAVDGRDPVKPDLLSASNAADQFRKYRNRVTKGPLLLAHDACRFFVSCPDADSWDVIYSFPDCTPPYTNFWVEAGGLVVERPDLPCRFGWYFRLAADVGQFVESLVHRGQSPDPDLAYGVVATCGHQVKEGHDTKVAFPVYSVFLQVARNGRVVGSPVFGFPFPVDMGLIGNFPYHSERGIAMFLPALFAVCVANAVGTELVRVAPDAKLQDARRKRRKRPFSDHHVVDASKPLDELRYKGMAFAGGLAKAFEACPQLFSRAATPSKVWQPTSF